MAHRACADENSTCKDSASRVAAMSQVVTRFAPSPTGRLHLGHAFSAIQAHDYARLRRGRFLIRIEDIDSTRCRIEYVAAILADLEWLGLTWDAEPFFQSARSDVYRAALAALNEQGLVYPCFCTRGAIAREIASAGAAPHGPGGAPYPGTCRRLSDSVRATRITEPHCWRLDMQRAAANAGELTWQDDIAGQQSADPCAFGDVVLWRKDAASSYHLSVTLDDAAQGVSHVVRGADLFAATHVHRLLQALLGLPTPIYRHHPLLRDGTGRRLAKRDRAPTLEALRVAGADGHAFAHELRSGVRIDQVSATRFAAARR